jgi:hypothetical protein
MPSTSYRDWRTTRAVALDAIAQADTAVGETRRERRQATQEINRAYAVLLASHFQGFCRDLHSECVGHLLRVLSPPAPLRALVREEFTRGRQLDRGNAQPAGLGADFGRLGIDFWTAVSGYAPLSAAWKNDLESLNDWRNAIAHQDFTSPRPGGATVLRLAEVRRWRASTRSLARSFDEVLRRHLQGLTGVSPW